MNNVLDIQEIAQRFAKSKRWVYNHALELGGFKIGGSWFFTEGGLEDAIQTKRWPVAGNGHGKRGALKLVTEHKKKSCRMGSGRKKAAETIRKDAAIRHGLIDA